MKWNATFRTSGLAALVLCAGCATAYEPEPTPRYEIGHTEPVRTIDPPAAAGDPGVHRAQERRCVRGARRLRPLYGQRPAFAPPWRPRQWGALVVRPVTSVK
jgi:hypothetical protein